VKPAAMLPVPGFSRMPVLLKGVYGAAGWSSPAATGLRITMRITIVQDPVLAAVVIQVHFLRLGVA
jgi:hypothetical protein